MKKLKAQIAIDLMILGTIAIMAIILIAILFTIDLTALWGRVLLVLVVFNIILLLLFFPIINCIKRVRHNQKICRKNRPVKILNRVIKKL